MLFPLGLLSQGGGAGAAGSFELIETAYGTGSAATITFSSIPSTYKHLQIRFSAVVVSNYGQTGMRFNGDSATNYSYHQLVGYNAGVTSAAAANSSRIIVTGPNVNVTSQPAVGIVDILDYADTNKHKTARIFFGSNFSAASVFSEVTLFSGNWRNTAAVTSITLTNDFNYTTAARFSLYGIKG
jgi:hypothetical protein